MSFYKEIFLCEQQEKNKQKCFNHIGIFCFLKTHEPLRSSSKFYVPLLFVYFILWYVIKIYVPLYRFLILTVKLPFPFVHNPSVGNSGKYIVFVSSYFSNIVPTRMLLYLFDKRMYCNTSAPIEHWLNEYNICTIFYLASFI